MKQLIVVMIQVSTLTQFLLLSLWSNTWDLLLVNIANSIFIAYVHCIRCNVKLTCKIGVFKEQFILGLALV